MRLLIIKTCLFVAADLLLLVLPCYLESLQLSSVCIGVRADGKMSWMWLLPTLQLKRGLFYLQARIFLLTWRGRKRKYSEIWTFAFTHRQYSSDWGYGIGTSEPVDNCPYIKFVKINSFVFDNSLYNSFHLLSNQQRSCRTWNLVGVHHECFINLHHPQPLKPVRVRKDRWAVWSYLLRSVHELINLFQMLPNWAQ